MERKILVIGSGGREHAIAHAFHKSKSVKQVYVLPGNPGMEDVANCVSIDPLNFEAIIDFCINEQIDLVFVGPELPLSKGIADVLKQNNILVFGPIHNLDRVDSRVYHVGTSKQGDAFINQGGRVLCVTSLASTLNEAKKMVYQDLKKLDAKQCFYRNDIGSTV